MATLTTSVGSTPTSGKHSAVSILRSVLGIAVVLLGVAWLIVTNPSQGKWSQGYDPTGHWVLSTLLAALPLVVLLGSMAIFKHPAHVGALLGLVTAFTTAVAIFHMPLRLALTSTVYGAGYGLFPICWIILPVIFMYRLTIKAGRF